MCQPGPRSQSSWGGGILKLDEVVASNALVARVPPPEEMFMICPPSGISPRRWW